MQINNNTEERKKEVVDICLRQFVKKGLYETTSRDLSAALRLQNSGIYYYFQSKDDVVIACAEEAAIRLEENLIMVSFKDLHDPEALMERLHARADEMRPMMKFFTSVCATSRYDESMKPVLDRLSKRYEHYAEMLAEKIGCDISEIEPYVYMCITAVSNYMIFGKTGYIDPQIEGIKRKLNELINN